LITYLANPNRAAEPVMQAGQLGMIVTPKQGNRLPGNVTWCADNGCGPGKHGIGSGYPGDDRYLRFLETLAPAAGRCLFAVAPDVVGDADATYNRSEPMLAPIRELGYKVAYVLQDGQEAVPVPWDEIDAVFVGGSTEFKLGTYAAQLVGEAKQRGLWVHMGRVNSRKRLAYANSIGCDSADGTYLTFGPDKNLPRLLAWLDEINGQPATAPGPQPGDGTTSHGHLDSPAPVAGAAAGRAGGTGHPVRLARPAAAGCRVRPAGRVHPRPDHLDAAVCLNTAEAERAAMRRTCPKCQRPPGKRCKQYDPRACRWTFLARPHEARVNPPAVTR
jgi:hypothetical protein